MSITVLSYEGKDVPILHTFINDILWVNCSVLMKLVGHSRASIRKCVSSSDVFSFASYNKSYQNSPVKLLNRKNDIYLNENGIKTICDGPRHRAVKNWIQTTVIPRLLSRVTNGDVERSVERLTQQYEGKLQMERLKFEHMVTFYQQLLNDVKSELTAKHQMELVRLQVNAALLELDCNNRILDLTNKNKLELDCKSNKLES